MFIRKHSFARKHSFICKQSFICKHGLFVFVYSFMRIRLFVYWYSFIRFSCQIGRGFNCMYALNVNLLINPIYTTEMTHNISIHVTS